MTNIAEPAELQVVVQVGGTSDEQYLHAFRDEKAAHTYICRARRASYECFGPFPVVLPEVRELAQASREVLRLLDAEGMKDKAPVTKLTSALANVRRGLNLC